jgi:hypothetical protein
MRTHYGIDSRAAVAKFSAATDSEALFRDVETYQPNRNVRK